MKRHRAADAAGARPRFLGGRSWRLLVPLLFGMLVIVPPQAYYEVVEQLPGGYHLRSTIMNPLIEERDLDELVAHLQALCR